MPLAQTYFLNGSSLSDSTAIYTNSAMTTLAPDGWYSDGLIIRQQLSGVLQAEQVCPSCEFPCGGTVSATGSSGAYVMNIGTGSLSSDVGAIVVRFDPAAVPDGIKVVYNGITYNSVSSQNHGWLGGVPSGLPVFLGLIGGQASCPAGSIVGGPYTLTEFSWDGTSFVPTGDTQTISVVSSQNKTTVSSPGECVMVIPKISPTPSSLEISCYGVCTDTQFDVSIECPALLKKFKGSIKVDNLDDPAILCALPIGESYYVASVNGVYPLLGLYDWVFSDQYGISVLPDGYYKTNNVALPDTAIQVQNGVIVQLVNVCP